MIDKATRKVMMSLVWGEVDYLANEGVCAYDFDVLAEYAEGTKALDFDDLIGAITYDYAEYENQSILNIFNNYPKMSKAERKEIEGIILDGITEYVNNYINNF